MLVFIIVFVIFLFLYIHLLFHWKVSNEIDIPHVTIQNKDRLENVADMRQPFIFEKSINSTLHLEGTNHEINIRKMNEKSIKVPHKALLSALKKEPFLSEKNRIFLKHITWDKAWLGLSDYLTPHMNWRCDHDILYGSNGVFTNLRYSMNYRNYFYVLDGEIELKLLPPNSSVCIPYKKNLCESDINVWEPNDKERESLDKTSTILIPLKKGSIIHIPAFWWYSIKIPVYSSVLCLSYSTYMNSLSKMPRKLQRLFTQLV